MKFTLNRDLTHASVRGHVIEFKKGEPAYVPRECWNEVISLGAISEDELDEEVADKNPTEPSDPDARKASMFAAFEAIMLRDSRDDFAASGAPNAKAVLREMGWAPEARERATAWAAFKTEKGEA
jgi:hypothetical protein